MGVYLGTVQTVVNRLPVESLADTTLQWMGTKTLLENPSTVILLEFNDKSIDSMIQVVARVVVAHFFYPRIAPLCALMNGAIGVVHLGIGFTQRFKTTEEVANTSKEWKDIALNIHKGLSHLLVAGYDFGIAFLLKHKYFDLGGVIAFAYMPVVAYLWHQRVFKKPGECFTPPPAIDPVALAQQITKVAAVPENMVQNVQAQVKEILKPPSVTPSDKVLPKYLENTCYIYIIAKRITLEMMPSIKEEVKTPEGDSNSGNSGPQVSSEETLPDFGL